MRRKAAPSEVGRLAAPLARVFDGAWRRMHWWVATMAVLYAVSGITVVRPDEVAVVLRWGRLVGATPALQEHGPGLLFAFPRPMDQVVRVPVKHVGEVIVTALASSPVPREMTGDALSSPESNAQPSNTLDPLTEGYALTGDQNIVQLTTVAHYRVRDPAEWAFYGPTPDDVLRVEVTAAVVRSLGEMGVDQVLSDGRKALIATATRRAQAGLDASHAGLELTSLELTSLAPPAALASEFDAVQSAFIGAETKKQEAQAYAATSLPGAQADVDARLQSARGGADAAVAAARGDADAFRALDREYRANPVVIRERLYRDALDRAIGAARSVRWVPPPASGKYSGFRVTIQQPMSGQAAADEAAAAQAAAAAEEPPDER